MLEVERSQGYGTHIQGNTCGSEAAKNDFAPHDADTRARAVPFVVAR